MNMIFYGLLGGALPEPLRLMRKLRAGERLDSWGSFALAMILSIAFGAVAILLVPPATQKEAILTGCVGEQVITSLVAGFTSKDRDNKRQTESKMGSKRSSHPQSHPSNWHNIINWWR